jgi:hypothetical protein
MSRITATPNEPIFNVLVVIVHNIEKIVRYAPIERQKRLAMA